MDSSLELGKTIGAASLGKKGDLFCNINASHYSKEEFDTRTSWATPKNSTSLDIYCMSQAKAEYFQLLK